MKTELQQAITATPSFDASYLIEELHLPYHITPAAREAWVAEHGLTHSLHIGLDFPDAGLFCLQIINRATGYSDASVTLSPDGPRHDYGPPDRHFKTAFETLAREHRKAAHSSIRNW